MMKYLQKLGKALMLPVAALPVCGILMGLGYALAPAAMGAQGATEGLAYTVALYPDQSRRRPDRQHGLAVRRRRGGRFVRRP